MIVEQRDYLLRPGAVAPYLETWHRLGRGPQIARLGKPLGVYTVDVGDLNTLVFLWPFADAADRVNRRALLAADPAFADFRRAVRDLVVTQTNRILLPCPEPVRGPEPEPFVSHGATG